MCEGVAERRARARTSLVDLLCRGNGHYPSRLATYGGFCLNYGGTFSDWPEGAYSNGVHSVHNELGGGILYIVCVGVIKYNSSGIVDSEQ